MLNLAGIIYEGLPMKLLINFANQVRRNELTKTPNFKQFMRFAITRHGPDGRTPLHSAAFSAKKLSYNMVRTSGL